jgi:hypothetical protein
VCLDVSWTYQFNLNVRDTRMLPFFVSFLLSQTLHVLLKFPLIEVSAHVLIKCLKFDSSVKNGYEIFRKTNYFLTLSEIQFFTSPQTFFLVLIKYAYLFCNVSWENNFLLQFTLLFSSFSVFCSLNVKKSYSFPLEVKIYVITEGV